MNRTTLKKWVEANGGKDCAAVILEVSPVTVWRWLTGRSKVSKRVVRIVEGKVEK